MWWTRSFAWHQGCSICLLEAYVAPLLWRGLLETVYAEWTLLPPGVGPTFSSNLLAWFYGQHALPLDGEPGWVPTCTGHICCIAYDICSSFWINKQINRSICHWIWKQKSVASLSAKQWRCIGIVGPFSLVSLSHLLSSQSPIVIIYPLKPTSLNMYRMLERLPKKLPLSSWAPTWQVQAS